MNTGYEAWELPQCLYKDSVPLSGTVTLNLIGSCVSSHHDSFFRTSPDVKNREIKLEWSGDKRDLPTAEAEISRVQASIIKWYASEYHNGRQVLDEIQTPSAINSELYTKMIYLTRNWSLYPNGDGCVTISSPEIKNKYPAAICLALGFFLSIVISVMFCLVKKMVDEYQQNSGQ